MRKIQEIIFEDIKHHPFCGDTIYSFGVACIKPVFTEPTTGEHDYDTCETCQDILKTIAANIEKKFSRFPDCCEHHAKIKNEQWFNREDYSDIAKHISTKVIYTRQHIQNKINNEDWYKDITDYIEYTVHSFGQLKYSGSLYLSDYIFYVNHFLENNEQLFTNFKTNQLKAFLAKVLKPDKVETADLNILLVTYDNWIKLFPFDISFFRERKEYYRKVMPFIHGKTEYNPYLQSAKAKMHTKASLLAKLYELTNDLLISVNTYVLNKNGHLNDIETVRMELLLAERENKLKIGYNNNIRDESLKFRKMLQDWFRDERYFIKGLNNAISHTPKPEAPVKSKLTILKDEFWGHGFADLPTIKGKLSDDQIDSIFELLLTKKTPYQIAMLHYLGFLDLLFETNSKEKSYKLISKALNAKQRVVKGNSLVLSPKSEESKKTYTSHLHLIEVGNDYQKIKLG